MAGNERFESVLHAYAIERQDDASALTLSFSMSTAAFTYMIAAAIFIAQQCSKTGCGSATMAQFLAPAIPIAILGFTALSTAATLMRSVELQTIEAKLEELAKDMGSDAPPYTPTFHRNAGLIWRSLQSANEPRIRWLFAVVTAVAYSVLYVSLFLFTFYVLLPGGWGPAKWVAACIYGVVELLLLTTVLVSLGHPRFRH